MEVDGGKFPLLRTLPKESAKPDAFVGSVQLLFVQCPHPFAIGAAKDAVGYLRLAPTAPIYFPAKY